MSGAREDRRPNRLLRRLFPLPPLDDGRIVPLPVLVLVGVGGMSSLMELTSRELLLVLRDGEFDKSSSLILRKLERLLVPVLDPKILTPLPKDSGEALIAWGLHGVVGEPNSC